MPVPASGAPNAYVTLTSRVSKRPLRIRHGPLPHLYVVLTKSGRSILTTRTQGSRRLRYFDTGAKNSAWRRVGVQPGFVSELKRPEKKSWSRNLFSGGLLPGPSGPLSAHRELSRNEAPRVCAGLVRARVRHASGSLSPFFPSTDPILRDNLRRATMTTMSHLFLSLGDSEH